MKNKVLFTGSGGATKFISIIAGMRICVEDYGIIPTDIAGISAGAMAGMVTSMGIKRPELFKIAIDLGLNLSMNDMFTSPPVKDNGNFNFLPVVWKAITGKDYLGVQEIQWFFKNNITEDQYKEWVNDKSLPNVWVMAVRPIDMKRVLVNVKDPKLSYQECLDWVSASSHMPVFAQPVKILNKETNCIDKWVDGGLRNHNPSPKFIDMFGKDISKIYSFYSRRDKVNLKPDLDWDKNIVNVIGRIILGMSMEISKRDSQYEILKQKEFGYELTQFFYPGDILLTQYDVNKDRLLNLYNEALEITKTVISGG